MLHRLSCLVIIALFIACAGCGGQEEPPPQTAQTASALCNGGAGSFAQCAGDVLLQWYNDGCFEQIDCAAYGGSCVVYGQGLGGCAYDDEDAPPMWIVN